MRMKKIITMVLLAAGFTGLHAETRLSGEIQSSSLGADGNPYIVEKDIVVPAGKQLTIKEGCVLLFNPFTGLNVNGSLSVEGSTQRPVIFSCINDGDFNPKSQQIPNPFDWNGIIASKESGSVHFQNFQLRYSVYGIKSQNPVITLQNGLFRQNGQFHFTLNDKIQYVQDNISYSFNAAPDSSQTGKTEKRGEKSNSTTKNIIRYSCLSIGVVGVVAGTIFALQAQKNAKTLKNWSDTTGILIPQYNALNDDLNSENTWAGVSFVLGGLGLAGFTLTFFF